MLRPLLSDAVCILDDDNANGVRWRDFAKLNLAEIVRRKLGKRNLALLLRSLAKGLVLPRVPETGHHASVSDPTQARATAKCTNDRDHDQQDECSSVRVQVTTERLCLRFVVAWRFVLSVVTMAFTHATRAVATAVRCEVWKRLRLLPILDGGSNGLASFFEVNLYIVRSLFHFGDTTVVEKGDLSIQGSVEKVVLSCSRRRCELVDGGLRLADGILDHWRVLVDGGLRLADDVCHRLLRLAGSILDHWRVLVDGSINKLLCLVAKPPSGIHHLCIWLDVSLAKYDSCAHKA